MTEYTESVGESDRTTSSRTIPPWIDWVVGAVVFLAGLALLFGGYILRTWIDRALVTDVVMDGRTETSFLTPAETVEVAVPTVAWAGLGLLVTGALMIVVAVGYVYRQRTLRRETGSDGRVSNFAANAVAGSVAAVVLSFIPFSQALGGAVAGYLEHDATGKSVRVGAVSGLLGVVPAVVVVPFVLVGLLSGLAATSASGLGTVVVGVTVVGVLFGAAFAAGLGAAGGYAGGYVADDGF